jgi:ketosteroid isomerase-like protein
LVRTYSEQSKHWVFSCHKQVAENGLNAPGGKHRQQHAYRVNCYLVNTMNKIIVATLIGLVSHLNTAAQSHAEKEILAILNEQTISWNNGNLEEFMKGYWNNDSLIFVGKNGVTYGYANALNNYKKSYPDTTSMGKLAFDILNVKKLSPEYYFVIGKWMLTRSAGNLQGHYTLVFKKINGKWKIISDHSS